MEEFGRARGRLLADDVGRAYALDRVRGGRRVAAVQKAEGLARRDELARLRVREEADRGGDSVFDARAPAAYRGQRAPDLGRVNRDYVTRVDGFYPDFLNRQIRKRRGVVAHARVAALLFDVATEAFERRARRERSLDRRARLFQSPAYARERDPSRREVHGQVAHGARGG